MIFTCCLLAVTDRDRVREINDRDIIDASWKFDARKSLSNQFVLLTRMLFFLISRKRNARCGGVFLFKKEVKGNIDAT